MFPSAIELWNTSDQRGGKQHERGISHVAILIQLFSCLVSFSDRHEAFFPIRRRASMRAAPPERCGGAPFVQDAAFPSCATHGRARRKARLPGAHDPPGRAKIAKGKRWRAKIVQLAEGGRKSITHNCISVPRHKSRPLPPHVKSTQKHGRPSMRRRQPCRPS